MATYINPSAIKDGTISASKTDETIATKEELTELSLKVGDLSQLQTTEKSNLVGAINEVAQGGGGSGDWRILKELKLTENVHSIKFGSAENPLGVRFLRFVACGIASQYNGTPMLDALATFGYYNNILTANSQVKIIITFSNGITQNYIQTNVTTLSRTLSIDVDLDNGVILTMNDFDAYSCTVNGARLQGTSKDITIQSIELTPITPSTDFTPGSSAREKMFILTR